VVGHPIPHGLLGRSVRCLDLRILAFVPLSVIPSGCTICTMRADEHSSVDDRDLNLRQIIDSAPALIHTARPDGYLDFFNQTWLDFVGQPLKSLLGWKWTSCIHPEDLESLCRSGESRSLRESASRGPHECGGPMGYIVGCSIARCHDETSTGLSSSGSGRASILRNASEPKKNTGQRPYP